MCILCCCIAVFSSVVCYVYMHSAATSQDESSGRPQQRVTRGVTFVIAARSTLISYPHLLEVVDC